MSEIPSKINSYRTAYRRKRRGVTSGGRLSKED
jgi:hypothetical protein